MEKIVSIREMQRNYRKLINQTKRTKQPIFLGKHYRPEAVLLDVVAYEELRGWRSAKPRRSWAQVKKSLERIRKSGKQNVNLAEFIRKDRQSH
ncbi:MAG: type II toxin-antitoxin system Phd/YefM family antitoxin [bacterium]|nr:type II toxin-antitoxin system Phd/YefM family antitoxin [bacterium]